MPRGASRNRLWWPFPFYIQSAAGAHVTDIDGHEAIVRTMATAGRAVVFSGTAVAIGLGLLLFMPLPLMRGFGLVMEPVLTVQR